MTHVRTLLRRSTMLLLATLTLAMLMPASAKSREKVLEETLRTYAATIRWGSIEQAESFVDPKYRETHPLTALELAALQAGARHCLHYRAAVPVAKFEVRQTVEIGLVMSIRRNRARSSTSSVDLRPESEGLVAESGLPDIRAAIE